MPSSFAWIDHSESHRRKMLDAIDLFREQGTRDELGLSVIRDGLANLMFPGTGALQTRARYFLFAPWMYQHLERERIRSAEVGRRGRAFEISLIDAVVASEDREGAIGSRARGDLQRLPSSIYWNGLKRFGIRMFDGTQDDYHRSLDGYYRAISHRVKTDDGDPVDPGLPNWHEVPASPSGFEAFGSPKKEKPAVPLALEGPEARYLADRIRATVKGSLLEWFLEHLRGESNQPFVWRHALVQQLPTRLRRQVDRAHVFSEFMVGAAILYNGMVCEGPPLLDEKRQEMEDALEGWFAGLERRAKSLPAWDRADFWAVVAESEARPTPGAQAFVNRWVELVTDAASARALWNSEAARSLIRDREWSLKRSLARLHSQHVRDRWTGFTGLGRMDFRWTNTQVLLNDILSAQERA
jgi:hypothetical protein